MPEHHPLHDAVKDAVVSKLKNDPDALKRVGPLVLEIARTEMAKPGGSTKHVLIETCHGAMSGLVLIDKDVCQGAVEVLKSLTLILQERSGDPMQTMEYALEGISRIGSMVSHSTLSDIGAHIEAEFQGAGEHFGRHAEKHYKKI